MYLGPEESMMAALSVNSRDLELLALVSLSAYYQETGTNAARNGHVGLGLEKNATVLFHF